MWGKTQRQSHPETFYMNSNLKYKKLLKNVFDGESNFTDVGVH